MIVPAREPARIVKTSVSAEAGRSIVRQVTEPAWAARARILKQDERSSVLLGPVDLPVRGGPSRPVQVVVKSLALTGLRLALSRLLGLTKGARQWRGAELAMSRAALAAPPLVLFRGRDGLSRRIETLVLEHAPGPTLLELLPGREMPRERRHALARALGAQVAALACGGYVNRDHKPSNIVVSWAAGRPVLTLIDTVGIRRAERVASRRAMLFALHVEAVGTGRPASATDRLRVVLAAIASMGEPIARWREDWRAVEARLRAHGDPRPRTSPL